ncbi:hypothetical protein DV495_000765 [Geotrichum candidum]|nr:hypothetical protein DV454_004992 [Geotrichum candidum]KAF5135544.1 hypothetical protein DV495_000765 [Geotrichum candidum]KAI8135188.1 hypothetical protein DUD61_001175 [Geotrichum candidum]
MPSQEFQTAADQAQAFTKKPTNDELLQLYALFKQATIGDNTTPAPGTFDFKAKAKWNAWKKLEGTSQEDAEKQYIEFVEKLSATYK